MIDPLERPTAAVTRLLNEAAGGEASAYEALLPLVYDELKGVAAQRLGREADGHTLSATALVHEAYIKLVDQSRVEWASRAHFYAVASQAMRRILIDHARTRSRAKRGGAAEPVQIDRVSELLATGDSGAPSWDEMLALDEAMQRLAQENPRAADIVQYRFFGGLTYEEIADVLAVSVPTVRRGWTFARMWLRRALGDAGSAGEG